MNVAAIMKEESQEAVLVARVGGDEFAVIVPDDRSGQKTEALIARIQSAFYKPPSSSTLNCTSASRLVPP